MTNLKALLAGLLYLIFFITEAGINLSDQKGKILGKILDNKSKSPIEYATVRVYHSKDSTLVTGAISDDKGKFNISGIENGDYYVLINFMSYESKTISNVKIASATTLNLGSIFLVPDAKKLDEVVITSEYNNIDYQIDKKVVSVDQQLSSASMTAVEVLENVPSINVDIDGNVSLRGSTGFVVLIDGKPTVLDPSDALRQMPASTILNIEIITNPSSKYVPDGTGGIINIITRQNRNKGTSGIANIRAGSFGMLGGDVLLNYKKGKSNFYFGADYRERINPSDTYAERRTTVGDTTTSIISDGTSERNRGGWSLRTGWDLNITKRDAFSLGLRIGDFQSEGNSRLSYQTFNNHSPSILNEFARGDWKRGGAFYNITGNFTHKFSKEKEEITLQVNFRDRTTEEENGSTLLNEDQVNVTNGSFITEDGPSKRWNIRLDYTKPFGKDYLLEIGSQIRLGNSIDRIGIYEYDQSSKTLVLQPDKGNEIDYQRDIYGFYGVFRGKVSSLGYQIGVRSEYTNRHINSSTANQSSTVDRLDFFPSIHLSYEVDKKTKLMANYSRRINRPRGWNLEPFVTWTDLFNVRQGNPDLLPEYIDAFELNYIKSWEKSRFSVESYYRVNHNRINRVTTVFQEGVLLSKFFNVGTDYALGIEGMYNIKLTKWWELNITANTFDYKIEGELEGESFDNHSFNWNSRISNMFNIKKKVKMQIDGRYNSATVTSQGESKSFYVINLGLRSDFLDKKLSVAFQVRDLFATATRASLVENTNLYNYRSQLVDAPRFSVNIGYRFNNYKDKRRGRNGQGGGDDDEF